MIYQSIMQWFSSYFNRSSWIWVAFLWKTSPEMNHLLPWVLIIENLENNSSEAVTATLKFGKVSQFGRKIALGLTQGFKMNKKFVDAFIISKAPEWVSCGRLIPAQHIIYLHYHNRRPTRLSFSLQFSDICVEPIIKQINHWRAKIISRDFEAYPKNMGYLIAAYSCHQIFCSKKLDPLPTKSITGEVKLLEEHRKDYTLP
ncbi:uncharacterized protein LOC117909308 isoform X1 [Vitis riparia]|uniref:uncharacterized protein LOC117909308 isoform X1 n=1 Tax=Vitis riparia TaxID=96939 RepID=UPI00155A952C|nr:uncharacterized protein LOC117909308 isoform X1 [Vitis riparia]